MREYIAVVGWTGPTLDKCQSFDTEDAANDHIAVHGGFVVTNPGGGPAYWTVDSEAQTVTNDQAQADADALASSWERLRTERNSLLIASDWTQASDSPLSDEVQAEWAVHREALRDLPATTDDPVNPTWPTPPE
jgi:hypothetical protein